MTAEIFSRISKFMRICGLAVPILWSLGCATTSVNMVNPITESSVALENQGIVVAQVINASGSSLPYNYLNITPKNLNESSEVRPTRLLAIGSSTGNSTVFTSHVDAGSYSLSSLRAFYSNGQYWYDRWAKGDVKLGTFEVVPGKVTDLGTIIYYPKNDGDRYIDTLIRAPSSDNPVVTKAHLPFFAYDDEDALTWNEDDYDDERQALYVSAVQNPVVYNDRYKALDGSIYFVGKLGTYIKRGADGEWALDAVDTNADLFAVAQSQSGHLVLGGEHGALFIKPVNQEQWQQLPIETRYTVKSLSFYKPEILDVVVQDANEARILRVDVGELSNLDWQTMAYYRPVSGWHDGQGNRQHPETKKKVKQPRPGWSHLIGGLSVAQEGQSHHIFLSTQYGSRYSPLNYSSQRTFTYDPATWAMSMSKGFADGIDNILEAGAVKLGVKKPGFWSWDGKNNFYRLDDDSTEWTKISRSLTRCERPAAKNSPFCIIDKKRVKRFINFDFLSAPMFWNKDEGTAFVQYTIPKAFAHLSDTKQEPERIVVETKDGGQTWFKTDKTFPSKYCTSTVPEADNVFLVSCNGVSGDFYESTDRGVTWQHVREHENI